MNRWISRKAIGLFSFVVLSPAVTLAFGPGSVTPNDIDPAYLALIGGSLLGVGLYRRKNP